MQKSLKRTLSLILAVVMVCAVLTVAPFTAGAAKNSYSGTIGEAGSQVKWSLDISSGVFRVQPVGLYGLMPDFDYPGSENPAPWVQYSDSIKQVVISSGVSYIGAYSFSCCENLSKITIEHGGNLENDRSIGENAFYSCKKLSSVDIPYNFKRIEDYAFSQCEGLQSVTFSTGTIPSTQPVRLNYIGSNAFYYCNLKKIEIPATVETIESGAFSGNYSLELVTVWSNTVSLDDYPFEYSNIKFFQCYENSPAAEYAANNIDSYRVKYIKSGDAVVSFDAKGGSGEPESGTSLYRKYTIPADTPTYGERFFMGWDISPNAEYALFEPGYEYTIASDVTLYAVWHNVVQFYDGDTLIYTYSGDNYSENYYDDYIMKGIILPEKPGKALKGFYNVQNPGEEDEKYYYLNGSSWSSINPVDSSTDFSDGVCKLYAQWVDAPKVLGTTVSLDGVIQMNFYVDFGDGFENWETNEPEAVDIDVEINREGQSSTNRPCTKSDVDGMVNTKKYSVGVYAKEMADTVTISISCYPGGEWDNPITLQKNYSVKEYLEAVASEADTLDPENAEGLRNLCYATLNYGAAAQKQFNHNTDNLANENVPDDYQATAVPANLAVDEGSKADFSEFGMQYYASSLGLFEDTSYAICFEKIEGEDVYANIGENALGSSKVGTAYGENEDGSTYEHDMNAYFIQNIPASDILNDFEVTFSVYIYEHFDDNGSWVDGHNEEKTYTFSPKTYIAKVLSNAGVDPDYADGTINQNGDTNNVKEDQSTSNLVNTVRAIYDYSVKASAYFK